MPRVPCHTGEGHRGDGALLIMENLMKDRGKWNRSAWRSGGERYVQVLVPELTPDELAIMVQRERIRAEFGARGVQAYDAILERRSEPGATGIVTREATS